MYLAFRLGSAFCSGGIFALLVRTGLATAGKTIVDPDTWQLFTLHGAVMVFVVIHSVDSGVARQHHPAASAWRTDVAFRASTSAGFYICVIGALIALSTRFARVRSIPAGRSTPTYST